VRLWTEAASLAPDIWVPHLMLGQELQLQGRLDDAVRVYRKAIALRPQEPYAYIKSAECLTVLHRYDEARELIARWRTIEPRSSRPLVGLGLIAAYTGRPAEARQYFLQAIAADPTDATARQSLERLDAHAFAPPIECLDPDGTRRADCPPVVAPAPR
jgi:Flp pilus assembly protein TadD